MQEHYETCINVLITGASGNIGSSLSSYFAKKRYELILASHTPAKLNNLSVRLKTAKSEIKYVPFDYENVRSFDEIKKSCTERLDGLVLITPRIPASENCFPDDIEWEALFRKAFIKPLALIKHLIDELTNANRAKVVIISGLTSVQPINNYCINGAIRAAWLAQAKALALQYGPRHVHFNTLSLGGVMTDAFIDKLKNEALIRNTSYEEIYQERIANVPLRKYASLIEVSKAVEALLSDMSNHMTGMNFLCDGGFIKCY